MIALEERTRFILSQYDDDFVKASIGETDYINTCSVDTEPKMKFGKLYTFQYFDNVKNKKYSTYDTHPIAFGLGQTSKDKWCGLNIHVMPVDMRIEWMSELWRTFENFIDKETSNGREPDTQNYIQDFNLKNILQAYETRYNIHKLIGTWNIRNMLTFKVINYYDWPHAVLCDEDEYMNGTLRNIQDDYKLSFSKMAKGK